MKYVSSVYGFDIYEVAYCYYLVYRHGRVVEDYRGTLEQCKQYVLEYLI